MPFPPRDKSMTGLLDDTLERLTFVERRLARAGGDTGSGSGSVSPVLAGTIVPYGGATVPVGWLICDGSSYNRADYPELFAAIGTTFGTQSGTTFKVPDLRGKFVVGLDPTDPFMDQINDSGGAKTVTLTTAQMPAHAHPSNHRYVARQNYASGTIDVRVPAVENGLTPAVAAVASEGGGGAHENLPPYRALYWIISIGLGSGSSGGGGGGTTYITEGYGIDVTGSGTLTVPYQIAALAATELVAGVSERATVPEAIAGLDGERHVTPAGLHAALLDFGGGTANREVATISTPSLAAAGQSTGTVVMAETYSLMMIQFSGAARVRLYDTAAHRDADQARARGVDPDRQVDHGLMLDYAIQASGSRTLSPQVDGTTLDGSASVPYTVDNLSAAAAVVTVTLTFLRLE